jgi:hypothetical protein
MYYNDDYSIDIDPDNLSDSENGFSFESNCHHMRESDLFESRKDERYIITSILYEHLKNLIYNHNLSNDNILDPEKINYLSFRKWIDKYITER